MSVVYVHGSRPAFLVEGVPGEGATVTVAHFAGIEILPASDVSAEPHVPEPPPPAEQDPRIAQLEDEIARLRAQAGLGPAPSVVSAEPPVL